MAENKLKKVFNIFLDPHWDITKYGEKHIIFKVKKEEKPLVDMERDIYKTVKELYPNYKKLCVKHCLWNPWYNEFSHNFMYTKFGWKVEITLNTLMDFEEVTRNIKEACKKYDIRKLTDLYEVVNKEILLEEGVI